MIIVRRQHTIRPAAVIIPVNNNVIHRDGTMSEIALTVSVLALVAVVGLWIGNVKIRGVGFGIGGVLFGGIIVGHFVDQAGSPSAAQCCILFRNSA
nr:putative transporter [Klebsiella pneumoniae]